MTKKKLPVGWRWVRLGDVMAEALPGFAAGERDPEGVIQLRMNNVDTRGRLIWREFIRVPASQETVAKYRLLAEDVLFNNTNSTELVGKSALFTGETETIVHSNHFTRLRTRGERLDSGYLASWLLYQWQKGTFKNLCNRWIGQSAVKSDKLLGLELPLPPLAEQKRIAAILNELIAAVEQARAAAEAQIAEAKALPVAYLREDLPKPGRELPRGWRWVRLGDVCEFRHGGTPSKANPAYWSGEIPWISPKDMKTTLLVDAEDHITQEAIDNSAAGLVPVGAVLIVVRSGILARCLPAAIAGRALAFNQDIKAAIPDMGAIDSQFLLLRLLGMEPNILVDGIKKGATVHSVKSGYLENLRIQLPPLAEQKRIASILNHQVAETEKLRSGLEAQMAEISAIPASLLCRAFRGEI